MGWDIPAWQPIAWRGLGQVEASTIEAFHGGKNLKTKTKRAGEKLLVRNGQV